MNELELKYGCNPNQIPARVFMETPSGEGIGAGGKELPIKVLNGKPGYINLLDALNGYQLVSELKEALGLLAAASFKHVSPAGAAVGIPLSDIEKESTWCAGKYKGKDVPADLSPLACAYVRARGADRMSSFGDFISLSDECDEETALVIKPEVSDGVIAPAYSERALNILKQKKKGNYTVLQIDPAYVPERLERKMVYGVTFEQHRNDLKVTRDFFSNIVTDSKELPEDAVRDLIISMITLKYTQSNSVCFALGGQAIGIGAGQQSRIHCTRLAAQKADYWFLRQSDQVLNLPFKEGLGRAERDNAIDLYISDDFEDILRDGAWQRVFRYMPEVFTDAQKKKHLAKLKNVSLGSDAFFPFGDNIERAAKSGVKYVAQPGGSIRDDQVIETADRYHITMAFTKIRLFHH